MGAGIIIPLGDGGRGERYEHYGTNCLSTHTREQEMVPSTATKNTRHDQHNSPFSLFFVVDVTAFVYIERWKCRALQPRPAPFTLEL